MSNSRQTDIWSPSVVVPITEPDLDAVGDPWSRAWPGATHMLAIIDVLFKISTDWITQDTQAIMCPPTEPGQCSPQWQRIHTIIMSQVERKEPTDSKAFDGRGEPSYQLADFSARGSDAVVTQPQRIVVPDYSY